MSSKLTFILHDTPEGGYTIACEELPELITECDSLDDMMANIADAFDSVVELYTSQQKPLLKSIEESHFQIFLDCSVFFEIEHAFKVKGIKTTDDLKHFKLLMEINDEVVPVVTMDTEDGMVRLTLHQRTRTEVTK